QEVHHEAVVGVDNLHHSFEMGIEEVHHCFRASLFRKPCEASEIAKQEGHLPPLAAEHSLLAPDHHFSNDLLGSKTGEGLEAYPHPVYRFLEEMDFLDVRADL